MFSFFDLFRRRIASACPATAKRKNSPRRRQLRLEALEERWVPSTYSIGSSFNSTAVAAGNSIWFTSIASGVSGVGATPATVTVTNQTIIFTDTTGGTFNESLPNAVLTFTPGGTSATTTYNTTLNEWVTNVPSNITGNVFLSAFALALPSGLHGSDNPVTWSGQFTTNTAGLKFNWEWAAAGYTGDSANYSSVYGTLGVKPCDSSTASTYNNTDKAGTPEGYTSGVIAGAKGTGGTNYVGSYTSITSVTPTNTATLVSIAGNVYNDANNNGVYDYNSSTNPNETGISGVTLTLTGTTTGGQTITPATTTTASDGTYTFSADGSGNSLVAGTYQIVETEPAGYYQGSDNIGTVSGTTDGTKPTVDTIGSITLTAGQNGINYNFGEVDPFSVASVPYPYSSSTANTNVAFNESEIMYGASVNLATSTLDLFYSDEHALCLGVSQVTANGTTTNYSIAQMPANSSTSSAINPGVGDTTVTGTGAAVDASGRPLFPSLFVTDITNNPTSTSGDWQFGGTAVTPSALYGSWKSYTLSVSGGTVTQSGGTDPATANGWTLPAGADPVPASVLAEGTAGYGTEIQWSLASLYSKGILIPGHNYRFYFIIHDGDQNRVGGDVGQAAFDFTYRGPVTIAGNVYNDVYGNGVDGAGDNGIGGVNLTLTGTTASGNSVTATTTTAANGAYTFTTDSSGNLLRGGTYQVTETPPSGYLPGIDTVGLTSWTTGFQTVLANTNSGGTGNNPGYVHDVVNSASDSIFTGSGSLDTNSITKWQKTTGQPAATNDIADVFGDTFNDSLTGHTFLLSGMDRYSSTSATTVGFWDFQNSVSVNANGTFSGVHTNGDLFFVVNVSVYGATSVAVYEWTGTDSTGSLTAITPPVGATDVFVNTSSVSVPWTFVDSTGNTSPQAGELLEIGVDLNAVYGLTVPHFTSFLTETRSGNTTGSSLLDFALGTLNTVSGSFTADGSLVPPAAIGNIVASDGQNGINYNFGEVQPVTIGGQVYQDTNGNGALDSGEPGISGVTLTLTGTSNLGKPVTATTTTAANGTYSFTTYNSGQFIPPGTYQIVETPPSGYLAGATTVGTVNSTAVGTVVTSGTIGSIVETTGQNGINYNFGEVKPVTISGTVYQDSNDNGLFDTGEPGMSGVTLTLSGTNNLGQAITATTTTATGGTYSFTTDSSGNQLRPGTYQVAETLASGFLAGTNKVGTVNGTADGALVTGNKIGSIALTSNQNGINYNFGEVQPVTISGTVYQDSNDNGLFDTGEPGLSGVTLTLTGTNGMGTSITATTTTAAGGTYSFTTDSSGNALLPGTYQVAETLASGYLAGTNKVGTVNGTADGSLLAGNKIGSIAVTSGQSGINYNFGEVQPVTISGLVYQDTNDNGLLDTGEPGIGSVTLTLTGTNGMGASITATTTTAAGGTYSFTTDSSGNPLLPGTYQIAETLASGFLAGTNKVGTVNGTADGALLAGNKIGSIAVTSGQSGINYNFGEVQPVTISGLVYQDTNGNGLLDTGEPGIGSVTLTLTGTNGMGASITATTTTAANGTYSFTTDSSGNALLPGTYQVAETLASGYLAGTNKVGTVNGTADGALLTGNKIGSIAVTSGQAGINYNFGEVKPVTISGLVYQDSNDNGLLDTGEPGIGSVTLTLTGTNGMGASITATVTTAANGTFTFTTDSSGNALLPGTYQVAETLPSGYLAGTNKVGTVNGTADGALLTGNKIGSIAVTSGQSGINYNFGEVQPVTISGTVYQDSNDNGLFDTGEPGISGVTLTLTGTNGMGASITATTTTAAGGTYSFTTDSSGNALLPGTYQVAETLATGYLAGTNKVGTVNGTADGSLLTGNKIGSIAVTSGQSGINYNFGEVQPVTISGLVYQDTNDNGLLDTGEPGMSGVTLTLTGTNGMGTSITATTTTAAGGTYSFTTDSSGNPLLPGTYQVAETLASGYLAGTNKVGTVNGTADGALLTGNKIGSIAVTSGQNGINYNFGEVQPVTISGLVYQDTNGNGVLNTGEPGMSGVTLTLTGTNGMGQSITATATTAAGGTFTFTTDSSGNALLPGTYQIAETLASGFLAGTNAVGTVNGTADGSLLTGNKIGSIAVTSGQAGINYNFGEVKPVTISGLVYQDSNDNGVLNTGEPGIAGVTLTLTGTNGMGASITATATTVAGGTFTFTTDSSGNSLLPGTYQIAETLASGFLAGTNAVGTVNGTADGSLLTGNKIGSIAVTSGQSGVHYNFGEVQPVTISGLVYQDSNDNGVLDSGEPGMSGVTLTLTGTNGMGTSITATTTTAANGTYSFTTDSSGNALLPGTYQVAETLASGFLAATNAVGTVNGTADGSLLAGNKIGSIAVTSGQSGINYNFGEVQPVTISGLVYQDTNGNGLLDSGEPGMSGVTLTLSGTNGMGTSITATTTTAAGGTYSFTTDSHGLQLLPGTYQVAETLASGFLAGTNKVGTVNGTADGTLLTGNKIGSIAVTSNQSGINYNFGEVKPVTVSGLVYQDTNGNGVLDTGEPGIAVVTLTLTGTNGMGTSITATTTTNANGGYTFITDSNGNALLPGTYQVAETLASGFLAGTNKVGTVSGTTDGTLLTGNKIGSIAVTSGQSGINYNFGEVQPVTISGLVYQDSNDNGLLDTGEPGIGSVSLTLSGTNGMGQAITATTTTTTGGTYSFTTDSNGNALLPGTYQVAETLASGFLAGTNKVGTVNGTTDGSLLTGNKIGSIAVTSGQNGINYNFGEVQPVTISGTVYEDKNGNGVLDTGEPGIAGVTLTLSGTNGMGTSITATTTTAAGGTYSFSTDSSGNPLLPGTYQVAETVASGYLAGTNAVGTVNGSTDGTLLSGNKIGSIEMTSGQSGINYNFGEVKPVTISGLVYQDTNDNGLLDSGEPGLAGVTLTLSGTNNLGQSVTATTTTASNGTYSFSTDSNGNLLAPGTYQVAETVASGYLAGTNAVGTVSGTTDGTLLSGNKIGSIGMTSGQSGINYNFGEFKPVTISGTVYQDMNWNGVLDSGEPGISGVTVTLSGTSNLGQSVSATTTTAADGTYSFMIDSNGNPLLPGTYQVAETQPTGFLQGFNTVGTVNGTTDGTLVPTDMIGSIVMSSSQSGINYNFGEVQPVTISGTVYLDSNANGVLDSGEPGIAGVALTLSGTTYQGQTVTATTTTAADGTYSFTTDSNGNVLLPGTYQVVKTPPSGYLEGASSVGTVNGTADGTANSVDKIGSIAMKSGQNGINYNFSEVQPVTISGIVYEDKNDNGVLDSGEPLIANVTLTLSGTNNIGQAVSVTTTTNANGAYTFTTDGNGNSLAPGTYQISETTPSGYVAVTANVGTVNGTTDGSKASPSQLTSIGLGSGQNGINYDFGLNIPASVSGYVYVDYDRDGKFDNSDAGLAGQIVTLTGVNILGQKVTLSVTTDANGYYIFADVIPVTYTITLTPPGGIYNPEVANAGTVNGTADGLAASSNLEIDQVVLDSGDKGLNYNFGVQRPLE